MSLRSDLKKLSPEDWRNERVKLRPLLTEDDLIYAACDCQLTEEQQERGNPAWFSIERAYLFPGANLPCLTENEQGEPIGFLNLCQWSAEYGNTSSWSCFIGRRHQKKGCGKAAAQLAVHILKTAAPEKPIKLTTEAQNLPVQSLYVSLGFQKLPEMDGDDFVFAL